MILFNKYYDTDYPVLFPKTEMSNYLRDPIKLLKNIFEFVDVVFPLDKNMNLDTTEIPILLLPYFQKYYQAAELDSKEHSKEHNYIGNTKSISFDKISDPNFERDIYVSLFGDFDQLEFIPVCDDGNYFLFSISTNDFYYKFCIHTS